MVVPLVELPELIAHEAELLAGMRHHVTEEGAYARELLFVSAGHLVDERALAVHHFVVRDGKHIVLGEGVHHREGELVVVVHAEEGIEADIREHIVHPAHVPLVVEPEAAHGTGLRDEPPRGRFFRDHEHMRIAQEHCLVELAQKCDRFEVLVLAIDVGDPLPFPLVVIEIEHGRYGIHAQTVAVEFIEQEAGGRDEEGKHFVPAVVKAAGAPALVFHPVPLAALVKRLSVKLIEAVRILGEVRGHPVEDDADPRIVEGIDERHEIFGRAEAGSHGKVARHLIPPRTVEGEFRHGHEFDVRIAHLLDIGNELARKVEIGIIISVVVFFPREQIDLVDVHRRGVDILFVERIEISAVLPFVPLEVVELGRIRRRSFGVEADGIGLHELPAVRRRDAVFVDIVLLETGNEQFERLPVHHALHDVGFGIPAVEVTDDGNALGVRSPDAEHIPFLAVLRLLVGAEDLVNTVVLAVVIEIEREIRLFAHIELLAHLLLFAHETPFFAFLQRYCILWCDRRTAQ